MRFLFAIIVGSIFLFFQLIYPKFLYFFHVDLVTLLVIYAGFRFPFVRSLLTVCCLGFLIEVFSFHGHGVFIFSYMIVVLMISFIRNFIFSESYLSQAFWIFILLGVLSILIPSSRNNIFYGFVNCILSIPLFVVLDIFLDKWLKYFNRRRIKIDEADFYQANKKDQLI